MAEERVVFSMHMPGSIREHMNLIRYAPGLAVRRRFTVRFDFEVPRWPSVEMDVVMVEGHRGARPALTELKYSATEGGMLPTIREIRKIPVHALLTRAVEATLLRQVGPGHLQPADIGDPTFTLHERPRGHAIDTETRRDALRRVKAANQEVPKRKDAPGVVAKQTGVGRASVYRWLEEEALRVHDAAAKKGRKDPVAVAAKQVGMDRRTVDGWIRKRP